MTMYISHETANTQPCILKCAFFRDERLGFESNCLSAFYYHRIGHSTRVFVQGKKTRKKKRRKKKQKKKKEVK